MHCSRYKVKGLSAVLDLPTDSENYISHFTLKLQQPLVIKPGQVFGFYVYEKHHLLFSLNQVM